jgi:ribonuclease G
LTVIDVNTGKFLGRESLEQTVLKTNLEAADEIVYQLRLRNIAGIIVVDFIDMRHHNNRAKVIRALESSLERDPAKNTVYQFTRLGLIQITRKRTSESAYSTLTESCPYCSGTGSILSRESVGFKIVREILRQNQLYSIRRFRVDAHPDALFALEHTFDKEFQEVCRRYKVMVDLQSDGTLHREQFVVAEA